jgi:hypothetical protein
MDYSNGKVYRLVCDDGHFYIGSTTSTLCKRLYEHKKLSKSTRGKKMRVYNHINKNGWDTVKIILIETVACKSVDELRRAENNYIEKELLNSNCLNSIHAVLNVAARRKKMTEWRANNVAHRQEYAKKEYEDKKVDIAAKRAIRVTCECGCQVSKAGLSRHKKTKLHQSTLAATTDG